MQFVCGYGSCFESGCPPLVREVQSSSVLMLKDSQPLVRVLGRGGAHRSELMQNLCRELVTLRRDCGVPCVIQWMPGHVGVLGNERADEEANRANVADQSDVAVEFNCMKAFVAHTPQQDETASVVYSEAIEMNLSVVLAQLRAGHCPNHKSTYIELRLYLHLQLRLQLASLLVVV